MTFIDFKKLLVEVELSLPKFANLIKVSDKNIQSYKKKGEVPNTIAVIVKSFSIMSKNNISYEESIKLLNLKKKNKKGAGFSVSKKI
ncbi:hypothetical protein MNB_ARC-1_1151 [hydrothermal vent metagenome]|uniref:Uncharacterized protein n=1 Tax=hydrothermal vent metagenome TaxID=652676 RepID=A0A3B1E9J4_9ZZZZ